MALPTIRSNYTTRKNVYEAAIVRRREKEENMRDKWNTSEQYFRQANIRTKKEAYWNSDKTFEHSMKSYLANEDPELKDELVEKRKAKLRDLFYSESKDFENELVGSEDNDSKDKMIERANFLKDKKEAERRQLSENLMYEHFRQNSSDLREIDRDIQNGKTVESWKYQKEEQQKMHAKDRANDFVFDELSEAARLQAQECDKRVAEQRADQERERAQYLQRQILELKEREFNAKKLIREEEALLAQAASLHDLEVERERRRAEVAQRALGRALLRQHSAALRRRCQQVQADLEADLKWLGRLNAEVVAGKAANQRDRAARQAEAMRDRVEEDLRRERQREAELDDVYTAEAGHIWSKREDEWRREREAREQLLQDVLVVRRQQVTDQLEENRRAQANELANREALLADLEALHGDSDAKSNEAARKRAKAAELRAGLADQLAGKASSREAELRREAEAERADRQAEAEYEQCLREETARMRLAAAADGADSDAVDGYNEGSGFGANAGDWRRGLPSRDGSQARGGGGSLPGLEPRAARRPGRQENYANSSSCRLGFGPASGDIGYYKK